MNAWASDYLLLGWAVISIFSIGIAVCHLATRLRGIELIGYGAGVGVVIHGLVGLIMGALPSIRPAVVALFFFLPFASLVYAWWRAVWSELLGQLSRKIRWSLSLWLLFLVLCVGIIHVDVTFPATLPDGRYVLKQHTLNVKIQYMTSLPCDNYIPYIVTEYLLRGISFKEERPILPANEVSNRTILMSLVALPFRAVLGVAEAPKPLGTFHYVGRDWPDVEKLNQNRYFEQFLIIGILLNSLLLVGLLVLFSKLDAQKILVAGTLLCMTNPYFLWQTIFIWPKAFAGFFILLAWNSLYSKHDPKLVALCAGLAYNCHPYAVAFAAPLALVYLWQWWNGSAGFRNFIGFAVVFLLSILPWLLWTRGYLGIPSDLIAQNFFIPGGQASIVDFIWIRLKNLFDLLTPRFFALYPFNAAAIVDNYVTCLPGAVGLLVIGPALFQLTRFPVELRWQIIVPAIAILVVFSAPSVPILHGYQPIVGTLIFLGLLSLRDVVSPLAFRVLLVLQLLCNVGLIAMQAWVVGVHAS